MSDTIHIEQRMNGWAQTLNTILTVFITAGVCWVAVEVSSSRERWARLDERMNTQSTHILELRGDFAEWKQRREITENRLTEIERRLALLEAANGGVNAAKN